MDAWRSEAWSRRAGRRVRDLEADQTHHAERVGGGAGAFAHPVVEDHAVVLDEVAEVREPHPVRELPREGGEAEIVGCEEGDRGALRERAQDRERALVAFGGVRTGQDLVEEDEGHAIGADEVDAQLEARDLGVEARRSLVDGVVDPHAGHDRERPEPERPRRHRESGVGHDCGKADGAKKRALAAHVRAGDEQYVAGAGEDEVVADARRAREQRVAEPGRGEERGLGGRFGPGVVRHRGGVRRESERGFVVRGGLEPPADLGPVAALPREHGPAGVQVGEPDDAGGQAPEEVSVLGEPADAAAQRAEGRRRAAALGHERRPQRDEQRSPVRGFFDGVEDLRPRFEGLVHRFEAFAQLVEVLRGGEDDEVEQVEGEEERPVEDTGSAEHERGDSGEAEDPGEDRPEEGFLGRRRRARPAEQFACLLGEALALDRASPSETLPVPERDLGPLPPFEVGGEFVDRGLALLHRVARRGSRNPPREPLEPEEGPRGGEPGEEPALSEEVEIAGEGVVLVLEGAAVRPTEVEAVVEARERVVQGRHREVAADSPGRRPLAGQDQSHDDREADQKNRGPGERDDPIDGRHRRERGGDERDERRPDDPPFARAIGLERRPPCCPQHRQSIPECRDIAHALACYATPAPLAASSRHARAAPISRSDNPCRPDPPTLRDRGPRAAKGWVTFRATASTARPQPSPAAPSAFLVAPGTLRPAPWGTIHHPARRRKPRPHRILRAFSPLALAPLPPPIYLPLPTTAGWSSW